METRPVFANMHLLANVNATERNHKEPKKTLPHRTVFDRPSTVPSRPYSDVHFKR